MPVDQGMSSDFKEEEGEREREGYENGERGCKWDSSQWEEECDTRR